MRIFPNRAPSGCCPGASKQQKVAADPYFRLAWDLTRRLAIDKPDLIHVQYTAPLINRVPVVVTVHDVSFIEHPEYFTALRRTQLRFNVARTVKLADRIITVSEFSRDAILRAYPVSPDKVRVIPNAVSSEFRVVSRGRATQAIHERFGIRAPFIFSVGDLQPRKNHIGLITAFTALTAAHPELNHQLVIAGQNTWFTPKVRAAAQASGLASRIHFTGFVSDADLVRLYNACDCFVFPSFYEGFGLPILEAMACGRAVACSNTSAMPEVADGAGLLFDPRNPASIARAMADILARQRNCAKEWKAADYSGLLILPGGKARWLRCRFIARWPGVAVDEVKSQRPTASALAEATNRAYSNTPCDLPGSDDQGYTPVSDALASAMQLAVFCGMVALALQLGAQTKSVPAKVAQTASAQSGPAKPALTGFPFTNESLTYTVNWPSGLTLGEAHLSATGISTGWRFELSLDASVPGFAVKDTYRSTASAELCSETFSKDLSHGSRKSGEKVTDRQGNVDGDAHAREWRRQQHNHGAGLCSRRAHVSVLRAPRTGSGPRARRAGSDFRCDLQRLAAICGRGNDSGRREARADRQGDLPRARTGVRHTVRRLLRS